MMWNIFLLEIGKEHQAQESLAKVGFVTAGVMASSSVGVTPPTAASTATMCPAQRARPRAGKTKRPPTGEALQTWTRKVPFFFKPHHRSFELVFIPKFSWRLLDLQPQRLGRHGCAGHGLQGLCFWLLSRVPGISVWTIFFYKKVLKNITTCPEMGWLRVLLLALWRQPLLHQEDPGWQLLLWLPLLRCYNVYAKPAWGLDTLCA